MALIEIGRIIGAHGFKGAFIAACPSGREAVLDQLSTILLGANPNEVQQFEISEVAWMPRGWKVKLVGIETDGEVKQRLGQCLYAERAMLPALEANEFYIADLIGAPVIDLNTGNIIGTFEGVEEGVGGQDRWWIKAKDDRIAIPATKHFIHRVAPDSTGVLSIWIQNYQELE